MKEIWVPIEGFPDYAVSNLGNVMNTRLGHILSPRSNSYGHYRVSLRLNGLSHERYIHRLVAAAFASNFDSQSQVYPHDGDYGNAEVTNIRLKGKGLGQFRRNQPHARVRKVRIRETGETFATVVACARHIGADLSTLYKVINGQRGSHKGFTFEYCEE